MTKLKLWGLGLLGLLVIGGIIVACIMRFGALREALKNAQATIKALKKNIELSSKAAKRSQDTANKLREIDAKEQEARKQAREEAKKEGKKKHTTGVLSLIFLCFLLQGGCADRTKMVMPDLPIVQEIPDPVLTPVDLEEGVPLTADQILDITLNDIAWEHFYEKVRAEEKARQEFRDEYYKEKEKLE